MEEGINMAQIGLKYLICAPITETAASVSYANGLVMSSAIKADISIEINEGTLYWDDRIIENIKEFKAGKVTLNGDHLSYEVLALLLGHKVESITQGNGTKLTAKGDAINFQTPTIEGTVLTDILGIWKEEAIFDTEASAKEWLDIQADIGGITE